MAEKKPMIVIKKINVVAAGHHGGAWKVAFADFMTAMMAFFLVMWLLGQSEETKKAISDYFSTPSIIEYNYQNYGAEITLEKLFLDLVNEPLKAFQSFMEPMDKSPNLLDMGSAKVVAAYLADQMRDVAKNVSVTPDGFEFDIPDNLLFERGTSTPTAQFVPVMDKLRGVVTGLKDAEVRLEVAMFTQAVADQNPQSALKIATERLDIVRNKVAASLENATVDVKGTTNIREKKGEADPNKLIGLVRVKILQKELTSDGKKPRKLDGFFGGKVDMKTYESLIEQVNYREQENARRMEEIGAALNEMKKEAQIDTGLPPSQDAVAE
ncbi:MAG: flagellar motor protein MotB [Bdellovibrionia bacterium]